MKIQIGNTECDYTLICTNAPRAYDNGAAIEVYGSQEERYVFIPTSILEWQKGRNGSGLHSCEVVTDENVKKAAISKLWQRVCNPD